MPPRPEQQLRRLPRLKASLLLAAYLLAGAALAIQHTGDDGTADPAAAPVAAGSERPEAGGGSGHQEDPLPVGAVVRLGTSRFRHPGGVATVVFAPDGKTLASAGNDGTVILWDAATGKPRRTLGWHYRHRVFMENPCVAFTPDGKALAVGYSRRWSTNGWPEPLVTFFDPASGARSRELGMAHGRAADSLAISPDGRALAAAVENGGVLVWDLAAGREKVLPDLPRDGAYLIGFSHDSKTLILASVWDARNWRRDGPGLVRLWDVAAGRERGRFVVDPKRFVSEMAVSPDGDTLAVRIDSGAALWRLSTRRKVRDLKPGPGVSCLAFSPDGKAVAVGCSERPAPGKEGGTVYLLDAATGAERLRLKGFARSVAFSPDGRRLAGAGFDSSVRLWDTRTGARLGPAGGLTDPVDCLAFAPDGRIVLTGDGGGTVAAWDAATGAERMRRKLPFDSDSYGGFGSHAAFGSVGVGPGGVFLATPSDTPTPPRKRPRVPLVWDVATGKEVLTVAPAETGAEGRYVCPVILSPDGRLVAMGDRGTVVLLDVPSKRERLRLRRQEGGIYGLWFTADGRKLATACMPRAPDDRHEVPIMRLWDTATGRELASIRGDSDYSPFALAPDGRLAVVGSFPYGLHIWDLSAGKILKDPDIRDSFSSLAFSPDSRVVACGGAPEGQVVLVDAASGAEVLRLEGHRGAVMALAFAADGRRLASAGQDTTTLIWDLAAAALAPTRPQDGLAPELREKAWADLGAADVRIAYRAEWALRASPEKAIALLQARLRPAAVPAKSQVRRLIGGLDNDRYAVREKASRELRNLGPAAEDALRVALKAELSLEVRLRVTHLLAALEPRDVRLRRALRCIHILEELDTHAAQGLLQALAAGLPAARETQEARAALARLAARPVVP